MALTPEQIAHSHAIDDLELLLGSATRTLREQTDLLSDALDALRAGNTAVAEEFVDRALTALSAEYNTLRRR